jgi:energy-coupling factor transport system ATP-binding protein
MEEVVEADYVYVMEKGKIVMDGTPRAIFSRVDELKEHRLDVPQMTLLADRLAKAGLDIPAGVLTREELVDAVMKVSARADMRLTARQALDGLRQSEAEEHPQAGTDPASAIILDHVSYVYSQGTAYQIQALKDINLQLGKGQFIGIIGHTGSGKSTLVQHMNGLNTASSGQIFYKNQNIYDKQYNRNELRRKIGMVFQYPEHQLFASTVLEDVCFGPENLGYGKETAEQYAKAALQMTGLEETVYEMSPFELSGGQKRRAAIAGVLAMQPEIVIFDEPTAALDPRGRDEIYELLVKLQKEKNITIILVSHSMEDMAKYAKRLIVMDKGKKVMDGTPMEIFQKKEELRKMGLDVPKTTQLMEQLRTAGLPVNTDIICEEEAVQELCRIWKGTQIC